MLNNHTASEACLFTLDDYRSLIRLARDHYRFVSYDRTGDTRNQEPIVFWRHDIDFSVRQAVQLAEIEVEEGVRATYFVHLHSTFYHFWERLAMDRILLLAQMGHCIGLHFDPHFYRETLGVDLPQKIQMEAEFLQSIVSQPVTVFSFHNTTPRILQNHQDEHVGGLINVYSRYFRSEVHYISDSGGSWRFEDLRAVLKAHEFPRLQVLIHPGWWTDEPMSPRDRVLSYIKERARATEERHFELVRQLKAGVEL